MEPYKSDGRMPLFIQLKTGKIINLAETVYIGPLSNVALDPNQLFCYMTRDRIVIHLDSQDIEELKSIYPIIPLGQKA